MRYQTRIARSRTIYKGRAVSLKVESLVEPGGVKVRREVVCHPGSVVLLPCFPDGDVLLVRQYRHPAGQSLWELPAGTLEPGEKPRRAAQRELAEETGYQARQLRLLFEFFPSPGILSEKMRLFEARGLTSRRARPDDDERIRVRRFSHRELRKMVLSGKIHDGKTLIGLLWFLGSGERQGRRRRRV
jgi:ADP-ribose pyrophosphatase